MRIIIRLKTGRRLGLDPQARAARQLGVWFGQIAAFGYAMTLWKYGYDLQAAERFAFSEGWLSHWQSWGAVSLISQWIGFRLGQAADARQRRPAPVIPMRPSSFSPRPSRSAPSIQYRAG